jgi:hypothetical protein
MLLLVLPIVDWNLRVKLSMLLSLPCERRKRVICAKETLVEPGQSERTITSVSHSPHVSPPSSARDILNNMTSAMRRVVE